MASTETTGGMAVTPGWYGADPTRMDLKTSPHGPYRQLREVQPVNLTPNGDWRLSRYRDVQKLLKHSHSGMRDTEGIIPGGNRRGQRQQQVHVAHGTRPTMTASATWSAKRLRRAR